MELASLVISLREKDFLWLVSFYKFFCFNFLIQTYTVHITALLSTCYNTVTIYKDRLSLDNRY